LYSRLFLVVKNFAIFFRFLTFLPSQQVILTYKINKTSNAIYAHDFDVIFFGDFTSQAHIMKKMQALLEIF